ncbi:MAG TPA: hypothetical protein V6D06_14580 [Trichocoleus sp.]
MSNLEQLTALLENVVTKLGQYQANYDALMAAHQETLDRIAELERKLVPADPETAYQPEAIKLLHTSNRTLSRRRKDGELIEGVHWWRERGRGRPIYNIRLIRDGLRKGFDSPEHTRACEMWLKAQPSEQRKLRRA